MDLKVRNFDDDGEIYMSVEDLPDSCPECKRTGDQRRLFGREIYSETSAKLVAFIFQCPSQFCREIYVAYYRQIGNSSRYSLLAADVIRYKIPKKFPEQILEVSPLFIKIYNQALIADMNQLDEISGCGYRRALEFLIKDYLKVIYAENQDKKKEIENKFLGKCIAEDIDNENIKNMARRAAWLGNDQTHYIKIWAEHDLQDLKSIIDITVSYINTELLAKRYMDQMPDG